MKTTIEIDEEKLDAVMRTAGFKTRRETVDWALSEALRIAMINKVLEEPWTVAEAKAAVDPDYDVIALRNEARGAVTYSRPSRARRA